MIHAPTWLRSIFSLRSRRRDQQADLIKGGLQGLRAGKITSQVSSCDDFVRWASDLAANECSGNKFNHDRVPLDAGCGNSVKIDERRSTAAGNLGKYVSGGRFVGAGLGGLSGLYVPTHKHILLTIDDNGEAYDHSGQKWSRAGRWPAIFAWLLILSMAAIVIATLMSEVWS